ncbi:protein FAR1-RELATED SEQUENCE 5-like [Miscanthus floridulus]|uniref:protein FAR1-RELATED SEQUENCE 5-like n=1 Tax=Miscanthus floridulus TaxID=154761 RepID=UPI003457BAAE
MSDDDSLLEYSEIVMKMFGSEDDGFEFYNNYAYEKGFSVRKEYCEWDNGHNERTLRKFVCSCEGFRAEKEMDYRAFGDVVVFDGTYKTNQYNLTLVPFVGVNHHKSTVLFACGILSHEDTESYVWLLRSFYDAMIQKHPVSMITDGDHAMQKAISIVWPNSSHKLCVWHIEVCIARNLHTQDLKDKVRGFLYDRCSIEKIERKWIAFLAKEKVTDKDSWLYQMYEMREIWCVAYHAGKCYLGLRSNQHSESLHSRIQFNLDRKMTLLELIQYADHCLSKLHSNEAYLDFQASSKPCLQPDASTIEKEAANLFTPSVYFADVQYSVKAADKCYWIETVDGYDIVEYIVGRVDKGDKQYYVKCEICVVERKLKEISCSCLKLQSLRTPCSHIFFVLGHRGEHRLPDCCVLERWMRGAKRGFPPIRKSAMYDYSDSLQRYHELHNINQTASFVASQSLEAYGWLKCVLHEEAAMIPPNGGENGGKRFGPVLPQALDVDSADVFDPIHVPDRGAPKKKLKSVPDKSKKKCTLCKGEGHNRRTCSKREEETMLPEDVLDI